MEEEKKESSAASDVYKRQSKFESEIAFLYFQYIKNTSKYFFFWKFGQIGALANLNLESLEPPTFQKDWIILFGERGVHVLWDPWRQDDGENAEQGASVCAII